MKPTSTAHDTRARSAAKRPSPTAVGALLIVLLLLCTAAPWLHVRVSAVQSAVQSDEQPDLKTLLLEVARNERAMLARRLEYTWTSHVTKRELNKRGEVTKQSVEVYEIYPVQGVFARKLVARDGVPLSQERAGKELKKAAERLEDAAREERKRAKAAATPAAAQRQPEGQGFGFSTMYRRGGPFSSKEIWMSAWRFIRFAEFTGARRERLREREAIVLDFRPRADFQPSGDILKPYARLSGRVWVDASEKVILRLEAWPHAPGDGAGGAGEPSVVFEHERLPDGVWLERLVRIKTYGHEDIFNGIELDYTHEAADFKRFNTAAGDDRLDSPKKPETEPETEAPPRR